MKLILIALAAAGIAGGAAFHWNERYYAGPASDHFDGRRFFNPAGAIGKDLGDVLAWAWKREPAPWPQSVPLVAQDKPPQRVSGKELRVTFVGHATVLIQTAGFNILADPIWSERAFVVGWLGPRRVTPPGIAFEDLPPIDLVLVSHNHYDHMDLPTLVRLREAHDPLFVVPLGNAQALLDGDGQMRIQTLDWWEGFDFNDKVRVNVVPVYHWSRRLGFDRNKALWGGFVVQAPGGNIYFAGDTGLWDGAFFAKARQRYGNFRLAVLPVGAYEPRWFMKDQHVNPSEAVSIHQLLGGPPTLGMHLRTFQLTDEAIDAPEIELAAALREQNIAPELFFTLPAGGTWSPP